MEFFNPAIAEFESKRSSCTEIAPRLIARCPDFSDVGAGMTDLKLETGVVANYTEETFRVEAM